MNQYQTERRLIRAMIPLLWHKEVDEAFDKLVQNPAQMGENSISMMGKILAGPIGQTPLRQELINAFMAGILVARSIEASPEFAKRTTDWIDQDEASGRNKIITFSDAVLKMRGM